MTTVQPLSTIEKVELREAWPYEARDFTTWLAKNIDKLGDALGFDLELQQTEAAVGGYSLDILATDVNGNRPVIIENQLETTDHDHLGKLLTYAAGFDANVVVWLAREFRDEHRQALDWLNQRTGEDTQFFGVVVELWKIDGSRPAPHFNLAAYPNGWRKETITGRSNGSTRVASAKEECYREFYQCLIDTLREEYGFTNTPKAPTKNSCDFPTGHRHGLTYTVNFAEKKQTWVGVYMSGTPDQITQLYEKLEERKVQIESKIGQPLEWRRVEGRKNWRIALCRDGSIDDDDDTLAEIQTWMVANLRRFKEVFDPHLKELVG